MGGGIMRYDEMVNIYDSKKIIFCFIRRAQGILILLWFYESKVLCL